ASCINTFGIWPEGSPNKVSVFINLIFGAIGSTCAHHVANQLHITCSISFIYRIYVKVEAISNKRKFVILYNYYFQTVFKGKLMRFSNIDNRSRTCFWGSTSVKL